MICRIVQFHLSLVDGAKPRAFASSHLQRCSACQQYKTRLIRLDQDLRSAAALAPSPSLHAVAGGGRARLPALAGLACAMAAVLLIFKFSATTPEAERASERLVAQVPSEPHQAEAFALAEVQNAPRQPFRIPQLEMLASRTPLQDELDALRQDGKRGLDAILSLGRRK